MSYPIPYVVIAEVTDSGAARSFDKKIVPVRDVAQV